MLATMSWEDARRTAAEKYRPDHIRLLLVAEAPPNDESRYFFFEDVKEQDSLFRYVARGVLGIEPTREDKAWLLSKLQEKGVWLVDVSPQPVHARAELSVHVPELVRRCEELEPDAIVLIKASVFDATYSRLSKAGLPVVNERIPFPGSGRQREFERAFARALEQLP
jgi:hypothetical protein